MDMVPTRFTKMLGWAGWGSAIGELVWACIYASRGQQGYVKDTAHHSHRRLDGAV